MNILNQVNSLKVNKTIITLGWLLYSLGLILTLSVYRHFSAAFIIMTTLVGATVLTRKNAHKKPKLADFYRKLKFNRSPIVLSAFALCLIMALGSLISKQPYVSFKAALAAAGTILVLMLLNLVLKSLPNAQLEKVVKITLVCSLIALVTVFIQAFYHISLRSLLGHGMTVIKTYNDLLVAALIPCLALWSRLRPTHYPALIAVLILLTASCYYSRYFTGVIAVPAGALIAFALSLKPKTAATFLPALSAFVLLAIPYISYLILSQFDTVALLLQAIETKSAFFSFYHRLILWDFASIKILQKPLLGYGAEAGRFIEGGQVYVARYTQLMPSHPHNFILQVWLETGLIGALCLVCFVHFYLRRIQELASHGSRIDVFWAYYYFMFLLFIFGFSHSLWHKWCLTPLAAGAVVLHEILKRPKNTKAKAF